MPSSADGIIKLSDGTLLRLRGLIVDVREAGFSPLGGINFSVNVIAGISVQQLPDDLRKAVTNRPVVSSGLPTDGWEIVDIDESGTRPAVLEDEVDSSKGRFKVRVIVDPVMASRNMNYRTITGEPLYWVSWVYKISWRPVKGEDA